MFGSEIVVAIVIVAVIFVGPWVISVMALNKCSALVKSVNDLETRLQKLLSDVRRVPVSETPRTTPEVPVPTVEKRLKHAESPANAVTGVSSETPVLHPPPPPLPTKPSPPHIPPAPIVPAAPSTPKQPGKRLEVQLGGAVASFVGIATLVIGISYFIIYAIQHDWVNATMRIIAGLFAAVALIIVGYVAEHRGRNLTILSRALTGGGVSLFYFTVFSAYHFHQFIGGMTCAVALVVCALICLGLASFYASQSIAILGVAGAFLTPMLVDTMGLQTTFILAYVACINIPVMLLGLRRQWQALYNLSLGLTVLVVMTWIVRNVFMTGEPAWEMGIVYSTIYFLEFAALGLLKLKGEVREMGRDLDIWRLTVASLLLYFALFAILTRAGQSAWLAEAYVAAGLLHAVLALMAWRFRPAFREEVLSLTAGAILFVTVAVPAELDGAAISIIWAIEGLLLAMFGLRARSALLVEMAALIGVVGLFKVLVWDAPQLRPDGAQLFLNSYFFVSLATVLGLAGQALLHSRMARDESPRMTATSMVLGVCAPLGFLLTCGYDLVTLGAPYAPWVWNLSSAVLLISGLIALFMYSTNRLPALRGLGWILMIALPLKIIFVDAWLGFDQHGSFNLFANYAFFADLALLACVVTVSSCLFAGREEGEAPIMCYPNVMASLAILAGVAVFWRDIFTLMTPGSDFAWVLSSATLLLAAIAAKFIGRLPKFPAVRTIAIWLVVAALFKISLVDAVATYGADNARSPIVNLFYVCQVAMLIAAGAWRWVMKDRDARCGPWAAWALNAFLAILGVIFLTTIEFSGVDAEWGSTAITLWWGGCGFVLAIWGLMRNIRQLRYCALALFGLTIFKVFLVDLSDLEGLLRISAFIGVGLLLLLLSYGYQKLAPKLQGLWDEAASRDASEKNR